MLNPEELLRRNEEYASERLALDQEYFQKVSRGQSPPFLWIGCSDSRVSANLITKSCEGELFVHCNIANQASNHDASMTSALQFAVEALKVSHIVVCGHYYCGGIRAAVEQPALPQVNAWVAQIREVYQRHRAQLEAIPDRDQMLKRLVELNVMEQVRHLENNPSVQAAWARGQELTIHGWVYDLGTGKIIDLVVDRDGPSVAEPMRARLEISGDGTSPTPDAALAIAEEEAAQLASR